MAFVKTAKQKFLNNRHFMVQRIGGAINIKFEMLSTLHAWPRFLNREVCSNEANPVPPNAGFALSSDTQP
jgi:hypothetical protein